jgi:hypothetical protein
VAAKTVTLTGLNVPQNYILAVINSSRGKVIYNLADPALNAQSYTQATNSVITLKADLTGQANTDALTIFYDNGAESQTVLLQGPVGPAGPAPAGTGVVHVVDGVAGVPKPLGAADGVATLDSSGKVPASQIPDIAVSDYLGSAANQAAMLALTGQKGDWVTRTDDGKVYVITGDMPSEASSWTALSYPVPSNFTGADAGSNGTSGLVPAPNIGDRRKYLFGNGTWSEVFPSKLFLDWGSEKHIFYLYDVSSQYPIYRTEIAGGFLQLYYATHLSKWSVVNLTTAPPSSVVTFEASSSSKLPVNGADVFPAGSSSAVVTLVVSDSFASPTTADKSQGKYLKADGSWGTAGSATEGFAIAMALAL